jgi:glycosyltransferase involved in cell wall biosynthesis
VEFLGTQADVSYWLSQADVFVFPSLSEGLGLSPVEAQAAGLPVLLAAHLPEEIDWLPGAVKRLALNVPREEWVRSALALREYVAPPSEVRAVSLNQSHFSMSSNVNILRSIYAA